MACFSPLIAYRTAGGITFSSGASLSGERMELPCGQCIGCRLERSRQWAMRCMHEAKLHDKNVVVTLTYDDGHLPDDGGLVKRDLQLYMKRLRKEYGDGIRFYACGEYGEVTRRPHYHAILFNHDFPDKRFYKKSKIGDDLYTSASAERIWQKGFCVLGSVTFESCAYVARYIVDKMNGPKADDWYTTNDGVVLTREFTNMSRNPGIGSGYYDKFGAEVYAHDSVIMRGREVRPPRFYDTRMEAVDPKRMEVLKRKRRRKALIHKADNSRARRRVKERVAVLSITQKREIT